MYDCNVYMCMYHSMDLAPLCMCRCLMVCAYTFLFIQAPYTYIIRYCLCTHHERLDNGTGELPCAGIHVECTNTYRQPTDKYMYTIYLEIYGHIYIDG